MSVRFSADEMFEIAEKIEKNGAAFYRKAAEMFSDDEKAKKLMKELAAMEEEHRIVYSSMRSKLNEEEKETTVFDPDKQVQDYLHAISDRNVFYENPDEILAGSESPKEVLQIAIGKEKDSIIFYLGIKDMVPERKGRDKIDDIIGEEKKHIVLLNSHLEEIK